MGAALVRRIGLAATLGFPVACAFSVGAVFRLRASATSSAESADGKAEYAALCGKLKKISYLEGTSGLLGWDEQVMMAPGSEFARGQQKAALAGVIHEAKTDEAIGRLLEKIEPHAHKLNEVQLANIREAKLRYERDRRMPSSLASKAAELETTAYGIWVKAREQSDFEMFAPILNETIDLRKHICRITKPDLDLYDAAIDSFDPRMKADRLTAIFDELKAELTPLIRRICDKVAAQPSLHDVPAPLRGGPQWDPAKQAAMCREIAAALGFDFARGRMDVSVHPFTGGSHPTDVRITTRYSADNWIEGLAGTIHECGHALYEQGRPAAAAADPADPAAAAAAAAAAADAADLPAGEALGMAVHESQSLLWERMVGQSLPFWRWATPIVHRHFPHTAGCGPEDFYRAVNQVRPSLIRVDADEVTYPLHVALRFELERDLFAGRAAAADLPRRWDEGMRRYLGVDVPSAREGVLQDVHWAGGALGYFPSYTLGAVAAAQLYAAAVASLPAGFEDRVAAGGPAAFAELRGWLAARVHRRGSVPESADALLREATGSGLRTDVFLRYITEKYTAIYGL